MKVSYQKRIVIMITLIFSLLLALLNVVKTNGVIKEGDTVQK
ncbi:hypothetical protein SAMN02745163_03044 [Clostridium cavendishii DSM 21758]|uniref:Uncharacterized protein n=1 Tax=Clostridium cavendishii DSM 21758 TaxID=1121302 RepID=A0A1M6P6E1_9CLOT|nr:hypothetical protein SAMN02745163_03044 [Clostridium cavendishii DSM 21758]